MRVIAIKKICVRKLNVFEAVLKINVLLGARGSIEPLKGPQNRSKTPSNPLSLRLSITDWLTFSQKFWCLNEVQPIARPAAPICPELRPVARCRRGIASPLVCGQSVFRSESQSAACSQGSWQGRFAEAAGTVSGLPTSM